MAARSAARATSTSGRDLDERRARARRAASAARRPGRRQATCAAIAPAPGAASNSCTRSAPERRRRPLRRATSTSGATSTSSVGSPAAKVRRRRPRAALVGELKPDLVDAGEVGGDAAARESPSSRSSPCCGHRSTALARLSSGRRVSCPCARRCPSAATIGDSRASDRARRTRSSRRRHRPNHIQFAARPTSCVDTLRG